EQNPALRGSRGEELGTGSPVAESGGPFFVLDEHGGAYRTWRHPQSLFLQELDMLLHPPTRLIQAIFDRMTDSREPFQVWRVEAEEIWIVRGFDDQRVA